MQKKLALLMFTGISLASFALCPLPGRLNAGLFGLFGGKTQTPPGWMLHKQSVSLGTNDLKAAERPCGNWSWVAGVVDMAETRGAHLDQQYLVDRLYGGSVCLDSPGDLDDLAHRISHDYVLPDGQKFRLSASFLPGCPTQADPLIVSLREKRPIMMLWRNHSYLLTGMIYDEYIAPTGNKMFIVTELQLFDPAGEEGKREMSFIRDRDNPDDLNGVLELAIYPK
jgi:hypothetical protein